jgi:chromosome segregation ATPase
MEILNARAWQMEEETNTLRAEVDEAQRGLKLATAQARKQADAHQRLLEDTTQEKERYEKLLAVVKERSSEWKVKEVSWSEREGLNERVQHLQDTYDQGVLREKAAVKQVHQLEATEAVLSAELAELRGMAGAGRQDGERLSRALDQASQDKDRLEEEVTALRLSDAAQRSELEQQRHSLGELTGDRAELGQLRTSATRLEAELSAAKKQNNAAEAQVLEAGRERDEKSKERDEMYEELEGVKIYKDKLEAQVVTQRKFITLAGSSETSLEMTEAQLKSEQVRRLL